jgi:hypothetical protein
MTEHCEYTCTVKEHANVTPCLAFEPLRGTEPKVPVRFSSRASHYSPPARSRLPLAKPTAPAQ